MSSEGILKWVPFLLKIHDNGLIFLGFFLHQNLFLRCEKGIIVENINLSMGIGSFVIIISNFFLKELKFGA